MGFQDWAGRRWSERFGEPVKQDVPAIDMGGAIVDQDQVLEIADRTNEQLRAMLLELGADETVFHTLDLFEASVGMRGVFVGRTFWS